MTRPPLPTRGQQNWDGALNDVLADVRVSADASDGALAGRLSDDSLSAKFVPFEAAAPAFDVVVDHGTVSGAVTIDMSQGNYHALTCSGAVQLTIEGWPADALAYLTLEITSGGNYVSFPSGWKWLDGAYPLFTSGTDIVTASTRDSGTNVFAALAKNYSVPNLPFLLALISLNPLYLLGLDETTGVFNDVTGGGYSGTAVGGVTRGVTPLIPSDTSGAAAAFDGSSGYLTETIGVAPATDAGAFSIVFSISAPDPGSSGTERIYAELNSSSSAGLLTIQTQSGAGSKNLAVSLRTNAGTYVLNNTSSGTKPVLNGVPHLIAFTYAGGAWAWYIDGTLTTSGTASTTGATVTMNYWAWGAQLRSSASNFFTGTLDDIAVLTRAITAAEVTNLYTAWVA